MVKPVVFRLRLFGHLFHINAGNSARTSLPDVLRSLQYVLRSDDEH